MKELTDLHQFQFTVIIADGTCINTELVRWTVLTTPLLGIRIFWDVKQCQLVNSHPLFQRYSVPPTSRSSSPRKHSSWICLTLSMMALWSFENMATFLPFNMMWDPRRLESSRLGLLLYSSHRISFWIALLDERNEL